MVWKETDADFLTLDIHSTLSFNQIAYTNFEKPGIIGSLYVTLHVTEGAIACEF